MTPTHRRLRPNSWGWKRRAKNAVARVAAARDRAKGRTRTILGVATNLLEEAGGRTVPLTTSVPLSLDRRARILDYGSGAGWWLRVMQRQGFSELSAYDVPQPALKTLASLGIRTFVAPATLPNAAFDCIRLEQVLEHVIDPVEVLQQLRKALASDGSIVLTVPNYGSWSAAMAGKEWPALVLPYHLTHFTERGLRNAAELAGLTVVSVRRQPIWEAAIAAVRRSLAQSSHGDSPPDPRYPLWRIRYHHWARRRADGEFIGVELRAK